MSMAAASCCVNLIFASQVVGEQKNRISRIDKIL